MLSHLKHLACYHDYLPRSEGDNVLGNVRLSACPWTLSRLNRLTYDLEILYVPFSFGQSVDGMHVNPRLQVVLKFWGQHTRAKAGLQVLSLYWYSAVLCNGQDQENQLAKLITDIPSESIQLIQQNPGL